jgi:hypothetical protein
MSNAEKSKRRGEEKRREERDGHLPPDLTS